MEKKKKIILILVPSIILALLLAGITWVLFGEKQEETVYKEEVVSTGELRVGISVDGTAAVGTTSQEFGIDISAYTGSSTNSSQPMMGGFSILPNTSKAGASAREIIVKEVNCKPGQQIKKGDPLMKLEENSLDQIRSELSDDVEKASVALEGVKTEQASNQGEAEQAYQGNLIYGLLADAEYQEKIEEAARLVSDAQTLLSEKEENIEDKELEITENRELLIKEKELLEEAAYMVSYIDIDVSEDLYGYVNAENARENAQKTVDTLEDEIEKQEEELEELNNEKIELSGALKEAEKEKTEQEITALKEYQIRMIQYENADEIKSIVTDQMQLELKYAEEDLLDAKKKLEEFDAYLKDGLVLSEYDGMITQVNVKEGDVIENKQQLITLNHYDDVTFTVMIEEDDIDAVKEADSINVVLEAYPDQVFHGKITEYGDANVNSYTSVVSYEAVIALDAGVSGILSDMSGEATFVTKEIKEVLKISNRAVSRNGTKSSVKMKENGEIIEKEVKTGFSDGTEVEIIEGLSEGDIVLIESKVE